MSDRSASTASPRTAWRRVASRDAELAWLGDPYENGIGYDPTGWDATTWVLHAMWQPTTPATPNPVDGPPWWGRSTDPGPGWRRVLWEDDLRRVGRKLDPADPDWPAFWLDGESGGAWGPDEGSLDLVSWSALVDVLGRAAETNADARAYLDPMAAQEHDRLGPVWAGPLTSITSLMTKIDYPFSPTNWWPADRSWFVWTDYDGWATKVSGSEELIQAVEVHPAIECIRWTGPDGRGGRSWEERERALRPTRAPSRFTRWFQST